MKPYRIAALVALACIAYAMSGCADYPITGTITMIDPISGAKGGLTFAPGQKPSASVKAPIYDDNGDVVGMVDVGFVQPKVIAEK